MISFTVRGIPAPQGSKRVVPSGRGGRGRAFHVIESSTDRVKGWRSDVRDAAMAAVDNSPLAASGPLPGPIAVELAFRFPRPKGHYLPANSRRPIAELRVDAPVWPASPPDIDKLARSVLDALTQLVFVDDSQVVDLGIRKRYADGEGPGVTVTVRDLSARTTQLQTSTGGLS